MVDVCGGLLAVNNVALLAPLRSVQFRPPSRRGARELMRKPRPLAVNNVARLDPLRSVQFSSDPHGGDAAAAYSRQSRAESRFFRGGGPAEASYAHRQHGMVSAECAPPMGGAVIGSWAS